MDAELDARLKDPSKAVDTGAVPSQTWQAAGACPTTIAVHDDRYMGRYLVRDPYLFRFQSHSSRRLSNTRYLDLLPHKVWDGEPFPFRSRRRPFALPDRPRMGLNLQDFGLLVLAHLVDPVDVAIGGLLEFGLATLQFVFGDVLVPLELTE
jgi:hypothetical protein